MNSRPGLRASEAEVFAAGELRPGLKAFAFEQAAHAECGLNDEIPRDVFARIEIEHQRIGVLDIVNGRRPGIGQRTRGR
jgi:hypothetical protein